MATELPDMYLTALQVIADQSDGTENRNKIGVTVTTNGTVYSGQLVSEEAWIEDVLTNYLGEESSGSRIITDVFQRTRESVNALADNAEKRSALGEFIHLVDAKLVDGNSVTNIAPVRITRSSVTAWSFGVAS